MVRPATHEYDPDKYTKPNKPVNALDPDTYGTRAPKTRSLPLTPINPNKPPVVVNYNYIQGMIDNSIEPVLKRVEQLESTSSDTPQKEPPYYRRIRKPKDTINRIFLVDNNDLVRFIFNAVEDVALPSLIGWRLWSPDNIKPLADYEVNRTEGHIINRETIYKTLDDVEELAMALIREHSDAEA